MPGEPPYSCSPGPPLDPRDGNYPTKLLNYLTFHNLILSFGDPVKILGPPPVRELQAGSTASQPGRNKIKGPTRPGQLILTPPLEILPTICEHIGGLHFTLSI